MTDKQLLKLFKQRIRKLYGEKCGRYVWGCGCCMAWRAYEDMEWVLDLAIPVTRAKNALKLLSPPKSESLTKVKFKARPIEELYKKYGV